MVQESSTAVYAFMENLFANNFPGLFSTYGDYYASRNCRKFVYFSWAIRVNHAAGYLCRVAILNPFQESYLLGERISFDRAETNHDKVASPKQQSNEVSIYIAHICINFKVVFFADNFRESAILNAVLEEILKKYIRYRSVS